MFQITIQGRRLMSIAHLDEPERRVLVRRAVEHVEPAVLDDVPQLLLQARKMLGWPEKCRMDHALLWEDSCKRRKLAQLLGQLGFVLTWYQTSNSASEISCITFGRLH